MRVKCVQLVSVTSHTAHCFCQELIYSCRKNAAINDRCKIPKHTFAVCVYTCSWSQLPTHVLYKGVTDVWCLLELEYLWFDNI